MPTRFYLSSTAVASVSPAFGAWTRTTEADRYVMSPTKDGSAMTDKTVWAGGSAADGDKALARQFVSNPMEAGIAFNTADTFKGQIRCKESGGDDNINNACLAIRVYSEDGLTLRATLLAVGHYASSGTEWSETTLTNIEFHDPVFSLDTGYTTIASDRLVVEVGGGIQAGAGGATVTGTMSFGSDNGTDLPEDQTTTTANNPWFEISRDITFQAAGPTSGLPKTLINARSGLINSSGLISA